MTQSGGIVYRNRLDKRILVAFRVMIGLIFGSVMLFYAIFALEEPDSGVYGDFFMRYSLFPLLIIAGLYALLEVLYRRLPYSLDYVYLITGSFIYTTLVFASPDLPLMKIVYAVPIGLSVMFFDKRKLMFATGLAVLAVLTDFAFGLSHEFNKTDLLTVVATIAGCFAVGMLTIIRGRELLENLEITLLTASTLRAKTEEMDTLNKIDDLTGLFNHRAYQEHLAQAIRNIGDNGGPLHLALLDIDNFKAVNDTYGHLAGDAVLKHVAGQLRSRIGVHGFAARYGGEEFVVVYEALDDAEVYRQLEALRQAVSSAGFEALNGTPVTISIGLHRLQDGESKEQLFKKTDECLYAAKRGGKNRVVFE